MKSTIMAAALLLATATAFADDAKPETKAEAAPRTDWYLKFDAAELQHLNTALMELPKRLADPLLAKLNIQLKQQQQQDNEAAAKQAGVK